MEGQRPATYGGPAFRPRSVSLDEEIREGRIWAPHGVDSDWSRLRDVLLHLPSPEIEKVDEPDAALLLGRIDHARLREQHDRLVQRFEECGIRVHHVRPDGVDDRRHPNLIFQCDVFWQTPYGAVISRMAGEARAGEERHTSRALAELGVPIALTVGGRGTLEGADCKWLAPDKVLCGVGVRTNDEGYEQLREFLGRNSVDCIRVPLTAAVQHLLGLVQIIAPDRAMVRVEHADESLLETLREQGLEIIAVRESEEVVRKLAFNFLVVDRERVIVPSRTPEFHQLLLAAGVEIVATVEVSEYVKAAGGIACATGILSRE